MNKILKIFLLLFFIIIPYNEAFPRSLILDTEIENLFEEYTKPLFIAADLPTDDIKIFVVSDPSINAFVMPNGLIFINSGLLIKADTPNEVISIIAHEIGHIVNNHHVTRMIELNNASQSQAIAAIIGLGTSVTGMLSGNDNVTTAGQGISVGGSDWAKKKYLRHSRGQEFEADMAAIRILESSGNSSRGLISMLEKIQKENFFDTDNINPLDLTHGLPEDRINILEPRIIEQSHYRRSDEGKLLHKHNLVRAKLSGYLGLKNTFKKGTIYNDYASVMNTYRNGRINTSIEKIKNLLLKDANNPYFYELLAQFYKEIKSYDLALESIRKANSLLPNHGEIEALHAEILILTDKEKEILSGITMLDKVTSENEVSTRYLLILSRAFYKIGNTPKADLYAARYYAARGQKDRAKSFARRAKKGLEYMTSDWLIADDIENINF